MTKKYIIFVAIILLFVPMVFAEDIRHYGEAFTFNNATGTGLNITGINGTFLTVVGAPTLANGKLINGTNFAGGASAFTATINAIQTNFSGSDDSKTVSVWVQPSATTASTAVCSGGSPGIVTVSNYNSGSPSANNYMCQLAGGYAYNREHPGDSNNQIRSYNTVDTANYHHVVFTWNATYNSTHGQQKLYYDGSLVNSTTVLKRHVRSGTNYNTEIGRNAGGSYYSGKIDIPIFYNYAISADDVTYLYNAGVGIEPPFASSVANFSIIAKDFYTTGALTNFTACILSMCYNTTTGTITTPYLSNHTSLLNITVNSSENGGYFNQTYINFNVSGLVLTANISQSANTFTVYEKVTNNLINNVNFSTSYLTNVTHYMRAQTYNVTATKSGYYNLTQSYTPYALTTNTTNFTQTMYNNTLNVTVRYAFDNSSVSPFNLTISNSTYGYSETFINYNGSINLSLIAGIQYTINVSTANSFSNQTYYTPTGSSNQLYVYLIKNNLVFLNFYDEQTLQPLTNMNYTIVGRVYALSGVTGSLSYANITNLQPDSYEIRYTQNGGNYTSRSYFLNIPLTDPTVASVLSNKTPIAITKTPNVTPIPTFVSGPAIV